MSTLTRLLYTTLADFPAEGAPISEIKERIEISTNVIDAFGAHRTKLMEVLNKREAAAEKPRSYTIIVVGKEREGNCFQIIDPSFETLMQLLVRELGITPNLDDLSYYRPVAGLRMRISLTVSSFQDFLDNPATDGSLVIHVGE